MRYYFEDEGLLLQVIHGQSIRLNLNSWRKLESSRSGRERVKSRKYLLRRRLRPINLG